MNRLLYLLPCVLFAFLGTYSAFAYEQIDVSNGGTITGKIAFNGTPPEAEHFQVIKNSDICGVEQQRQTVSVENGALQDVVVMLENVKAGKPLGSNVVDVVSKNCVFEPYLSVVARTGKGRKGSPYMKVVNLDNVIHNPHPFEQQTKVRRTLWNIALPDKGSKTKKQLVVRKSNTVRLECDQHTFMLSWTRVVDNPYWAISEKDGSFSIADIPAGTYAMVAWHPTLGEQKQEITIAAGGSQSANFAF